MPKLLASSLNSDFLFSISFFALSHAPPEFEADIATYTPDTMIPARSPSIAEGPNNIPATKGVKTTNAPGRIIFLRDA